MKQSCLLRLFAGFTVVLAAGCGGEQKATVTGIVKIGSDIVPGGSVTIGDKDMRFPSRSKIERDGKYTCTDVPYGDVVVIVETTSAKPFVPPDFKKVAQKVAKEFLKEPEKDAFKAIPLRYSQMDKTPLKLTVSKPMETYDIKLDVK